MHWLNFSSVLRDGACAEGGFTYWAVVEKNKGGVI
jgi:hypothetical protein